MKYVSKFSRNYRLEYTFNSEPELFAYIRMLQQPLLLKADRLIENEQKKKKGRKKQYSDEITINGNLVMYKEFPIGVIQEDAHEYQRNLI
jgi:hypothetical protein